jgi:hypothetical protein
LKVFWEVLQNKKCSENEDFVVMSLTPENIL